MDQRSPVVHLDHWPVVGPRFQTLSSRITTSRCHVLFGDLELEFDAGKLLDALETDESRKIFDVQLAGDAFEPQFHLDFKVAEKAMFQATLLRVLYECTRSQKACADPALYLFVGAYSSTIYLGKGLEDDEFGMEKRLTWLVPATLKKP